MFFMIFLLLNTTGGKHFSITKALKIIFTELVYMYHQNEMQHGIVHLLEFIPTERTGCFGVHLRGSCFIEKTDSYRCMAVIKPVIQIFFLY